MRQTSKILLAILLFSVILRIAVALYLGNIVDAPPLLTDQRSYHALGARLIAGHGYSFDIGWYPFTLPDTPTAHWSFLYSLFVAAVYEVAGVQPLAARLVQAVLGGVLLPWMAFRFARRLFNSPADEAAPTGSIAAQNQQADPSRTEVLGLLTAALAAIYPYFVLYAATLMTETFYITALLWSLERALAVRERLTQGQQVGVGLAVTLGLSLGIAVLLRQSILPWVVVLFVWLLWIGWRMGQSRDDDEGACNGACADRAPHPALYDPQLSGLRPLSPAQLQRRVCHVLGSTSHARHRFPGIRGRASAGRALGTK